jgi:hypothetical protein
MMRSTSNFSVCLVVTCAGLLFVFSNSVWPQETKKPNPRIKELQQKRLAVLEQVHNVAQQSFMSARSSFENVYAAKAELLAARRDYADTKEERIKACDEAVQEALNFHKVTQKQVEAGGAPRITELKAQAFVFETQLVREKVEAAE